jgi:hypothetical protein
MCCFGFRIFIFCESACKLLASYTVHTRVSLSPGVNWLRHKADQSPPSSAKVKNGGAIPALPHISQWLRGFFFGGGGVKWDWGCLVCWSLFGLLSQPQIIDEFVAFGGMRICKGNWSTWRKPAQAPLYSPHIPYVLTWYQIWVTTVRSQWLTAYLWPIYPTWPGIKACPPL